MHPFTYVRLFLIAFRSYLTIICSRAFTESELFYFRSNSATCSLPNNSVHKFDPVAD